VHCIYHVSAARWPDKFQRIINKICNGQRGMEQVFIRIILYSTLVQYSSAAVFSSVTSSWKLRPVRSAATSHKLCLRSAHGVWPYRTVKRLTCNVSVQNLHCPPSQSTGGMPVWQCYLYTFIKHKNVLCILHFKMYFESHVTGPGQFSWYSDSLRAGRSRDQTPFRARFSAPVQTGSETHPASYRMGTGYRDVASTTHPHLAPRLKKE
jgi:hypothetical protein